MCQSNSTCNELTDWFDGSLYSPGTPGLYIRESPTTKKEMYSWWDGQYWYFTEENVSQAIMSYRGGGSPTIKT